MDKICVKDSENHEIESKSSRIKWIDALKGFAIILVVVSHVAERYYKFDLIPSSTPMFQMIYNIIYSFHMPLFMTISGFLFQLSYMVPAWEEKKGRYWKHWWNLAIVYTGFSILLWLTKRMFSDDLLHPVTMMDIVLIWIKPIGHMWYLYVLLIIYLIFYSTRKVNMWIKLITSLCLCLASTFIKINWFGLYYLMRYSFFFYIGIILFIYSDLFFHRLKGWIIVAVSFLAFAIGVVVWLHGNSTERYFGIQLIVGLGVSVGLIWAFKNVSFLGSSQLLELISQYSLEIYILHQYSVVVMTKVMSVMEVYVYIAYLSNVVVSIGVVIIGVELLKKINVYELFFKPIYRQG